MEPTFSFRVLMGFLTLITTALAAPTYTPLLPPSYPLAVRNPFLSAWLPGNSTAELPTAVPQFWAGQNLTWSVIARVDGTAYSLLGVPDGSAGSGVQAAVVNSASYTSTRTTFELTAGNASIALEFFSPVSPKNYTRQSIPFSYLTVSASGISGAKPSIQVYSDIDNSWTGQPAGPSTFNLSTAGAASYYSWEAPGNPTYSVLNDMALWGNAVYASLPSANDTMTTASGSATSVRSQFASTGTINGTAPWASGVVTAFAHNMGSSCETANVTFAIGYVRDAAVNYLGNPWTHFYEATLTSLPATVSAVFADYEAAYAESAGIDSAVASAALTSASSGANYSDILSLSVRQVFGAIDVTINQDGLDTADPMFFLKEISSDGNVNTMDVIFPAFPIFYSMNPDWIRYLLEPVVRYLKTGDWPNPWCIHDIGDTYPNATGHNNGTDEQQPVEETGNMLILAYMYSKASGNTEWAQNASTLFHGYADYLVQNGLNISAQLSTDDAEGPTANQTDLAIKAAVGLTSYGALFNASNYTTVGLSNANQLYNGTLGTTPNRTHFTREYGNFSSWTTTYNLYPDKLAGLNTFPQAAYDMESAFYPTVRSQDGVSLDSTLNWGKTDWMHFAASYCSNTTQDMFVNDVHAMISNGENDVPFTDRYYVASTDGDVAGAYYGYKARPVVGGHFAILALAKGPNSIG